MKASTLHQRKDGPPSDSERELGAVHRALTNCLGVVAKEILTKKVQAQDAVENNDFVRTSEIAELLTDLQDLKRQLEFFTQRWGGCREDIDNQCTTQEHDDVVQPDAPNVDSVVKRGQKLHQSEYYVPILQVLVENGGSMVPADCIDEVGRVLADRLSDYDHGRLKSRSTYIRWRNTAAWARNALVKSGLMSNEVPGLWLITEAGRDWLKQQQG